MLDNNKPLSWFNEEEDGSGVKGYMCLIDFECEVGAALGGNRIFPSVEDLKRVHTCADTCGIVEVRVVGVKVIQPGKDLYCETCQDTGFISNNAEENTPMKYVCECQKDD